MIYRVIGLMSGSSLDGLDICFVHLQESSGKWNYEIIQANCFPYSSDWINKLTNAVQLNAEDYLLLHSEYGFYLGESVNHFIKQHGLQYQVQLIASHGHTTFHIPSKKMTAQLGHGAAIASSTEINTVSDLRAIDVAFGGEGAPIVPIGEKLLFADFDFFLNLGGIANITATITKDSPPSYIAYDVCPANRVLNLLANEAGKLFDEDGNLARSGNVNQELLKDLNALSYYQQPYPKSLANDFGTDEIFPFIKEKGISTKDSLRTYVEHICVQIREAVKQLKKSSTEKLRMMATGGGVHNLFLVETLREKLEQFNVELTIPEKNLVDYKEALIMALIGVLRWREETNVLSSVTGASRDSIGGSVWIGQEA